MKETTLTVRTNAREEVLIVTDELQRALSELTAGDGICTIVVPHRPPARPLAPASYDVPLIRASRTFSRREKDLDEAESRVWSLARSLSLRERVAEGRVRGLSSNPSAALWSRSPARGDKRNTYV
jgi:hypothetical protein